MEAPSSAEGQQITRCAAPVHSLTPGFAPSTFQPRSPVQAEPVLAEIARVFEKKCSC
jgi:hypothetical protein